MVVPQAGAALRREGVGVQDGNRKWEAAETGSCKPHPRGLGPGLIGPKEFEPRRANPA